MDGAGIERPAVGLRIYSPYLRSSKSVKYMKPIRKGIITAAALLAGVLSSSATVIPQGWWRYGENTDYYADLSGNNRRFGYGFSCVGSGNAGGVVQPFGCGGPLGTTGATSTSCVLFECGSGSMWGPGGDPGYNPPAVNYVVECWCLPVAPGRNNSWLLASGSGGGVALVLTNDTAGTMFVRAMNIGNGNPIIGEPVAVDPTRWTHLAIVNDNGTNTFYVNGVPHGAPDVGNATTPAGVIHAAGDPGSNNEFHGYLDELRISTFAPGAFAVSDLLLRPTGPNLLTQPQPATIWDGGAAPFSVTAAFDTVTGYQWQKNGVNIPGATAANAVIPQLFLADSGTLARCVLTGAGISVTSAVATATVVAANPANTAAYRNLVTAESSLLAYFPVDGDVGATLTNVKDATHNGAFEGTASYDGRTNRAFGQRALGFNLNGDVTIPANPAFEFSSGNGTIEALVYLSQATPADPTIFSEAYDGGGGAYYSFGATKDGGSLTYGNDSGVALSWVTPAGLLGKWTHVALVIDHTTNVTAYVNGFSLGTKNQASFGGASSAPAWIGSSGINSSGSNFWAGTIDELAVYGSALSSDTIAIHSSKFQSGTNEVPAVITGLPATGSKTLLAGGSASFTVQATGGAPLSYKWTLNGVAIPGATSRTLTLSPTTIAQSGTYGVTVKNPYAETNSPTFDLTFVAPTDSYAVKVMNDNPSAYWRLAEASSINGATAFDQAGGHDGTYVVNTAPGYFSSNSLVPNITNPAVRFNGYDGNSGLPNAFVQVPYSPVFNQAAPFSVETFCVPFYDGNNDGGVLVSSYSRPSGRQGWMLGASYNSSNFDWFLFDGSTSLRQVNSAEHCYANVLVHLVGVYDGTNAYIYVNGHLSSTWAGPTYVPNQTATLAIATRSGQYIGFDGIMDEVAFYSHALSANQISNHWSALFAPAVITTQPVGVTTNEGSTVTLTAAVTGYPITFQWYKDNVALDAGAQNYDGTTHYSGGVTSPTLVITQTTPSDNGSYKLQVSNPMPGGGATTTPVNVVITLDQTAPKVLGVVALGTPNPAGTSPFLVKVWFNKRIDAYAGTYAIAGATVSGFTVPQEVVAAPVGADWREAVISTTGLTPGQTYTLSISGVKDQTVSQNLLVATNVTFRAPFLSQGLVVWDYYYLGSVAGGVSALTGNQNYLNNAPQTNAGSSTFDSTPVTGGDLNNKGFGAAGDNYGASLSGWITPKVTGDYTFFIASDDQSDLLMNTNSVNSSDPQGAVLIANEPGCCNGFAEPSASNPRTSQPITLQANTAYFIRALQVEGGGGDYVKVAWRLAGDPTPAGQLTPISGIYLSSYAPGPASFSEPVYSGGKLTISWTGTATLLQSTNVALPSSQWTPVPGNSPFTVTPATGGPLMFYRLQ